MGVDIRMVLRLVIKQENYEKFIEQMNKMGIVYEGEVECIEHHIEELYKKSEWFNNFEYDSNDYDDDKSCFIQGEIYNKVGTQLEQIEQIAPFVENTIAMAIDLDDNDIYYQYSIIDGKFETKVIMF